MYQFANGFVADNGFHLNGDFKNYGYTTSHYRPFTLESSFGYCDALQEMLMQEHQGYVCVFPAVPDKWKDKKISFTNLRSYGGVLVSAKWEGDLKEIVLRSGKNQTIRLKNTFADSKVIMQTKTGQKTIQDKDGYFTLSLSKGIVKLFAQ